MPTYTAVQGTVPQYSTSNNTLASGYYLKFYQANTTTPLSMATDSSGGTLLAKAKLNDRGMPISNPLDNETIFIPHMSEDYRIVLYKTEADADADDTANADYNIPKIEPSIAPSADAADVTLRTVSIEAQDDYDRSPLFVDGTDFTAGAGPHTITVPSGWDPTEAAFRVYRLDASDIVTALTPTSDTTTTFTLAETLLSTDVIFIGDEAFRNQMDGDPSDIRTRLSVYSKAEGDSRYDDRYLNTSLNLQEIEDAGAAAQADAQENIGLKVTDQTVELGGDFSSTNDSVRFIKVGKVVTMTTVDSLQTGVSTSSASSATGIIPVDLRPIQPVTIVNDSQLDEVGRVTVTATGNVSIITRDWTGAEKSTTTFGRITMSYISS